VSRSRGDGKNEVERIAAGFIDLVGEKASPKACDGWLEGEVKGASDSVR
jgi:hypothetical protein